MNEIIDAIKHPIAEKRNPTPIIDLKGSNGIFIGPNFNLPPQKLINFFQKLFNKNHNLKPTKKKKQKNLR